MTFTTDSKTTTNDIAVTPTVAPSDLPSCDDRSIAIGKPPAWSQARLEKLRYAPRTSGDKTYEVMKLSARCSVRKTTFELAWRLFWRNAYLLDRGRKHPVETLCSGTEWEKCSITQRRNIGRCIKYFADYGVLPITLAHEYYPLAYLLNGDLRVDPLS